MSRTSMALKRLGVAGVVVATIGAGVPAFFATAASAANTNVTAVSLSPDADSAPTGTCNQFTATVTFNNSNGDTATVDVQAVPRAIIQDVNFCSLSADGTTFTAGPTGDGGTSTAAGGAGGTEKAEYPVTAAAGSSTGTVTFGIVSAQAGVVDVTAFVEGATGSTGTVNNTPDGNEPKDTSEKTFTAGGAGAVSALDAEPESAVNIQGDTHTFTAKLTQSDGSPVPGVTGVKFFITSGPDASATVKTCTAAPQGGTTDQKGTVSCSFTNAGGPGTDNITVFFDRDGDGVNDGAATEPQDDITKTFQSPQAAGTTVDLTCEATRTNTAGDACVNPVTEKTEKFTATVKNAAGTPVAGAAVQFSITGQTNDVNTPDPPAGTTANPDVESISPTSCTTDANGQCSTTVTNPRVAEGETVTVTARIVTAPGSTNVTDSATKTWRTPTGNEARNIDLTPATQTVPIGSVATVSAKVTDRLGNGVKGVQVTFTEDGTGRFTNGSSTITALTDASGVAKAELTTTASEAPGSTTVTGTITGYDSNADGVADTFRGAGTTDDECEKAANATTSPAGNAPGQVAGNCSDTAAVTFGAVSPSPTGTGTPGRPTLSTSTPDIQPNIQGVLTATGLSSNTAYELRCYSRPSTTYFTARSATTSASATTLEFRILPGTNTRCYVRPAGNESLASNSVVINVHTSLSLSAYRDGVRRYHFQGTNLPRRAGQLITLYRWARADNNGFCDPHIAAGDYNAKSSDPNCVAIRTATAFTNSSNVWRIDRTFTGSGQFIFQVRSGQNLTNAAGVSNARLTIIH